jgi:iron(II)-dependent oxidoreductase
MLTAQDATAARQTLLIRLARARVQTDRLFEVVKPEFLYERPVAERHRILFYLGHLEAFDWNLLRDRLPGVRPFNKDFDKLFAFGIDPVGVGLPSDQPRDWPAPEEVARYGGQIRETLDAALEAAPSSASAPSGHERDCPMDVLLNTTIEHRLMHAETLAYMLHQLPIEQKIAQGRARAASAPPIVPRMVEIPAGLATLGLPRDTGAFGWDNEYEQTSVFVPRFSIDPYKITHEQYFEFVSEGGYENPSFWTDDGWNWRTQGNVTQPVFWKRSGNGWYYRTMFEDIPLPMDWPVYVSHAEASAYARWAGKTLPTEAQWHRAAYGTPENSERDYPWGREHPAPRYGNFDFASWDPVPVGAHPEGQSAWGVQGLLGNGWEWTSSPFEPLPGFQAFPFYPGYSANFFDGKHFVLKGGSGRTAACLLRRSFRNWFQPHYPYVYAGFRCVSQ